jgi:phosphoribosyl-ATP pyrophosphohydrolase
MNIELYDYNYAVIRKIDQMDKVNEEYEELLEANYKNNEECIIEETFDLIQTLYGYLKVIGLSNRDIVIANKKHLKKLKGRQNDHE